MTSTDKGVRGSTYDRAAAARSKRRQAMGRSGFGYLLLLPPFLVYAYFILYPLIQTGYYSLTSWNGATIDKTFIGLGNFIEMGRDPQFWAAFEHTAVWVVAGTIGELVLSLALAMFVWNRPKGFLFFRTIYFMPQVLPVVVVGIVWVWIYSPLFGILNRALKMAGLDFLALGWLGDPNLALFAVLVASVWAHVGLSFVIFVAALQNVERELLEAARIDGANAWQRFRYVVVPQLSNAITLVTVLLLVHGLQGFDLVWVMTHGGPNNATQLLSTYAYQKAFVENQAGYGSAISLVLAFIALVVSVITVHVRERKAVSS